MPNTESRVELRREFRRALHAFQVAAVRLSEEWDAAIEVVDYPDYLPSFDEFAADVQEIVPVADEIVTSVGSIIVVTPTNRDELLAKFGENDYGDEQENADQIAPLGPMPEGIHARLRELAELTPGATVTLARDWERCVFGMVEGSDRFDVLTFGEDGSVGEGGVNLPRMFDSFGDMLAARMGHEPDDREGASPAGRIEPDATLEEIADVAGEYPLSGAALDEVAAFLAGLMRRSAEGGAVVLSLTVRPASGDDAHTINQHGEYVYYAEAKTVGREGDVRTEWIAFGHESGTLFARAGRG